jgi:hypothetical protein
MEARTLLSASLGLHVADKEEMDTSKRCFRGCFPLLFGNCISFDGLDILSAEYPPIPTRRITMPSTVTMSRTRGAKSKRAVKKKVKQEVKVKKEVQKNVMIDSKRRSPVGKQMRKPCIWILMVRRPTRIGQVPSRRKSRER